MPRFHLGQRVLITGLIATKHRDREASVISIHRNTHTPPGAMSADKYLVQFDDGHEAEFYDIQLVRAPEERRKRA
jgi:hypothetical protein